MHSEVALGYSGVSSLGELAPFIYRLNVSIEGEAGEVVLRKLFTLKEQLSKCLAILTLQCWVQMQLRESEPRRGEAARPWRSRAAVEKPSQRAGCCAAAACCSAVLG